MAGYYDRVNDSLSKAVKTEDWSYLSVGVVVNSRFRCRGTLKEQREGN
jgi:hypothetical protein